MEEGRREPRVPLACEVGFRRHGDARYRIDLLDFSTDGCCVAPPVKVESGQRVSLRIADIEAVHGSVAWSGDGRIGIHFDKPFHPAVFHSVVARIGEAQPSAS